MAGKREELLREHRKDLSTEERQVEALEKIADAVGKILGELVDIRTAISSMDSTYKRP